MERTSGDNTAVQTVELLLLQEERVDLYVRVFELESFSTRPMAD